MSAAKPAWPVPAVPVSWGELIDKLTILEIKSERIAGEAARRNVARELDALRPIADGPLRGDDWLTGRKLALKRVNQALWDIEDRIRAKESALEFDAEFVELARAVYKTNDERARIKKAINLRLASALVEEKSYRPY